MDKRNKIKPIETSQFSNMVLYFISFYLINKFLFLRGCFLILVFLRRVSKSESEDDDFCSHKEKNCLMLLKVFETLSLQVQASPGIAPFSYYFDLVM